MRVRALLGLSLGFVFASTTSCSHRPVATRTAPKEKGFVPAVTGYDHSSFERKPDRKIDLAEFERHLVTGYSRLDPKGTGAVSAKQIAAPAWAKSAANRRSKNGKLSVIEFLEAGERQFKEADQDKDGTLNDLEIRTIELRFIRKG